MLWVISFLKYSFFPYCVSHWLTCKRFPKCIQRKVFACVIDRSDLRVVIGSACCTSCQLTGGVTVCSSVLVGCCSDSIRSLLLVSDDIQQLWNLLYFILVLFYFFLNSVFLLFWILGQLELSSVQKTAIILTDVSIWATVLAWMVVFTFHFPWKNIKMNK